MQSTRVEHAESYRCPAEVRAPELQVLGLPALRLYPEPEPGWEDVRGGHPESKRTSALRIGILILTPAVAER